MLSDLPPLARRRPASTALFVLATLLLGGCSRPSDRDYAVPMIVSAPFLLLLALGAERALLWGWRKIDDTLAWDRRPAVGLLVVATLGTAAFLLSDKARGTSTIGGFSDFPAMVALTLLVYGTSYLALVLVVWRVWFARSRRTAFAWAFVPPFIAMVAPAVPMALGLTNGWSDVVLPMWLFPGAVGAAPAVLLAGLGIEIAVRLRRRQPAAEPRGPRSEA